MTGVEGFKRKRHAGEADEKVSQRHQKTRGDEVGLVSKGKKEKEVTLGTTTGERLRRNLSSKRGKVSIVPICGAG